jgi:hypothetical protein
VFNPNLVAELCDLRLWNDDVRQKIMRDGGMLKLSSTLTLVTLHF